MTFSKERNNLRFAAYFSGFERPHVAADRAHAGSDHAHVGLDHVHVG